MTLESENQLLVAYYNCHPAKIDQGVKNVKILFDAFLNSKSTTCSDFEDRTFVILGDFDLLTVERRLNTYEFPLRNIKYSTFYRRERGAYQVISDLVQPSDLDYEFKAVNCIAEEFYSNKSVSGDLLVDKKNLMVGVVKCVLNKIKNSSHYDGVAKLIEYAETNSCPISIYKSYSWEDINIFIYSNSIPEIFDNLVKLCNCTFNETPVIRSTNTTVGFRYSLYNEYMASTSNERSEILSQLSSSDKVELAITTSYTVVSEYQKLLEVFTSSSFTSKFVANNRPGIKDFIIRPHRAMNNTADSNTQVVVAELLHFMELLKKTEDLPAFSFESILIDQSGLREDFGDSKGEEQAIVPIQFADSDIVEINNLRLRLKDDCTYISTPLRDELVNLVLKYKRLLKSNRRIYYSMSDLYAPIADFINSFSSPGSVSGDVARNYEIFEVFVQDFVRALKLSINNRLDASVRYGYNNDYAHAYNLSKHGFLSSIDGYIKLFSSFFSDRFLFCYLDSLQGILTTKHFIRIDGYHLFKSELLAYLFIFELGIRYIEDDKATVFRDFAKLINVDGIHKPNQVIYEWNSENLENKATAHRQLEDCKEDLYEVIFPAFFNHQFCDHLSYKLLFDKKWEDFSFWFWSNYLCSYKAKKRQLEDESNNKELRARFKRFYSRYYFLMHYLEEDDFTINPLLSAVLDSNSSYYEDKRKVEQLFNDYVFVHDDIYAFHVQSGVEIESIEEYLTTEPDVITRSPFNAKMVYAGILSIRDYLQNVKTLLTVIQDSSGAARTQEEIEMAEAELRARWKFSTSGGLIINQIDRRAVEMQSLLFEYRTKFYQKGMIYSDLYRSRVLTDLAVIQPPNTATT